QRGRAETVLLRLRATHEQHDRASRFRLPRQLSEGAGIAGTSPRQGPYRRDRAVCAVYDQVVLFSQRKRAQAPEIPITTSCATPSSSVTTFVTRSGCERCFESVRILGITFSIRSSSAISTRRRKSSSRHA